MNWHLLNIDEVLAFLKTSGQGLSGREVESRKSIYGLNKIEEKKKRPAWMLFLNQFKDFMILVLIAAAIISGITGDLTDTIIIIVIIVLNAIFGFVQEYRAEKAMQALKQLATPYTQVLRSSHAENILSTELVPGDLVLLDTGNIVPADMRLMETHSLRIEESSLTGESVPVDKVTDPMSGENLSLGDHLNMAYKGTLISNGRGAGIVVATGMNTEIGKIARLLQQDDKATPLQRRMADFGRKLTYLIIIVCMVLFTVGLLRGEPPMSMLLIAISLAVAAIPEALPALITISLARGAKQLVKQNVLVRNLPAVETLGAVTYICSDKTGTLTQNKMTVVEVVNHHAARKVNAELSLIECAMSINHDVKQTAEGKWMGDPTELALVNYIESHYNNDLLLKLQREFPRVAELPFDSDRKCMTTVHKFDKQFIVISKGAVEAITAMLAEQVGAAKISAEAEALASKGIRVLAYGYRIIPEMPEPLNLEHLEKDLNYAGLAGMIDPPREEVKEAIRECRSAGIRPVMITGDHKQTAIAIAREIGILADGDQVVSGPELSGMTSEQLESRVEKISVYARVSPEQKLRIVHALQAREHFVAMTGDGVNDAPSLRAADIGIAMGISGTDVSKEAAHMILLDDNFATIVKAVKEGRRIYDNIRKFVKYVMTCNGAEIWTIFLAPLFGLPIPLLPIHILWINLVTDGLPGLALSSEKSESTIMKRPPRKTDESLFAEGIGTHIIWVGLLMASITLATQAVAIRSGALHWQTMVFTVLSLAQLGHVFAIRTEGYIFKTGFFTNMPLVGAICLTFLLQLGVIYLPAANKIFKTQPLSAVELIVSVLLAITVFHAVELEKWIRRSKRQGQELQLV